MIRFQNSSSNSVNQVNHQIQMSIRLLSAAAVAAVFLFSSCDEDTNDIGISLTDQADHLAVASQVFEATSRSVAIDSVVSRSTTGYLGRIKDPETDAYVTADFMTQLYCFEGYTLTAKDSVASRNEAGEIIADSCEIRLFYNDYYGDSLATMKLTLYELDHPMKENTNYYSDFSPLMEGYVRENGLRASKTYTLINNSDEENSSETSYINNICVRLNDPYTDKEGKTHENYGTYILRQFYEHPEYFKSPSSFRTNVVPGFFFKVTGGMGSMAYVAAPQLNIYYRLYINKGDSIAKRVTLFCGTEEILQTTTVSNDVNAISNLVSDESCTYIKSPSGIFTELTLPVDEIMAGHEKDTINSAKIVLNRINNVEMNTFNLPAANMLLMLERDSLHTFFEKSKVANYKQSFLANFYSSSNTYTFNNIGSLITSMYNAKKDGMKTDPNWVANHPNWNKVMLVPVTTTSATYSSSSILTDVRNDMSLTSTRLQGGRNTPLKIHVIYSKFE